MEFKIHSFVDVITNSSTEIYSASKEKIKENLQEIINSLTYIANTDIDIRDIFEIHVSSDGGGITVGSRIEDYLNCPEDYEGEEVPEIFKTDPELVKKMTKSMEALFTIECVDYY